MKSNLNKQFLDSMSSSPAYWKGPFYFNRKDPRLMVPKIHPSLGWTLNFANLHSYILIVALIGIVIVCALII